MSVSATAAPAANWNSHAAWTRLQTARLKLAADLTPVQAGHSVITADRAAVTAAENAVARIESSQDIEALRLRIARSNTGNAVDVTV
ncbi:MULTISPECIES: hypothetical protein [Actinoplanes]|uniref:hypothetical protein n=1 Tax=Actinoplanes TaxID=1865 RepID=UPI0005F2E745|nr:MULTISPECIES: hypothetical protein [Actinoplanes]GLY06779.1 hypothetical protein Acsp01_71580 [Actinoplanes sp. NBRC 101535]